MANKKLAVLSLMATTSLVLAACGGATPVPPTAAPAKPAATAAPAATSAPAATAAPAKPTEAPKPAGPKGGTVRILYWQAPTILNPHLANGTKDFDASRLMIEPLAAYSPDAKLVPILAAEIPTLENGGVAKDLTNITWKLKKTKWSDGSAFTADDVVFTWQYCANKDTGCSTSGAFGNVDKVEKIDDSTVKVTYKKANPNVYESFVSSQGGIIQKKQFAECVGANASKDSKCQAANNAPVGTGPYKLKEFKSGDTVTYVANENYRDYPNKPFFAEVLFKGGGDAPSAARAAFQTGDTDYAWNLQVEAAVLTQLANDPAAKATLMTAGASSVERIVINFANPDPALGDNRSEPNQPHPALSDAKVRRALMLAIDRKTMAEQLYGPTGDPTCELVTWLPYIDPKAVFTGRNCVPNYDEANKLLDEAGWKKGADGIREKDGKKLKLTYMTSTNTLRQKEQALVKEGWAKIGVDTELKNASATVFFSTDQGSPDTIGKFYNDVQMYTNNSSQPDGTTYLCDFTTKEIASKANGWRTGNNGRYSNKDYDALCEQLRNEGDPAKRKDIVLKMNDILVTDVVVIPLVFRKDVVAVAKDLKGVNFGGWDSQMWNIADWSK